MRYEIKGGSFPVVECNLESGEQMITERGSMVWMSPNMQMETRGGGFGKMFAKAFSGESMFQNTYTARGAGMIAFGSSFPGQIKAINIGPGQEMILQKSAFLAAEAGVELSLHLKKNLGVGLFGGEGFIMQRLSLYRDIFSYYTRMLGTEQVPMQKKGRIPGYFVAIRGGKRHKNVL